MVSNKTPNRAMEVMTVRAMTAGLEAEVVKKIIHGTTDPGIRPGRRECSPFSQSNSCQHHPRPGRKTAILAPGAPVTSWIVIGISAQTQPGNHSCRQKWPASREKILEKFPGRIEVTSKIDVVSARRGKEMSVHTEIDRIQERKST
jgi:hypothetical protein